MLSLRHQCIMLQTQNKLRDTDLQLQLEATHTNTALHRRTAAYNNVESCQRQLHTGQSTSDIRTARLCHDLYGTI